MGSGLSGSEADQGVNFASDVIGAAGGGGDQRRARPSRKWSFKVVKGSWGRSSKIVVSWPVFGSGLTTPASLTRMPRSGILATM